MLLAALVVLSALGGWAVAGAIKRQWRQEPTDQQLQLISPGAWGEPDLARPSVSPEALAEVAELKRYGGNQDGGVEPRPISASG